MRAGFFTPAVVNSAPQKSGKVQVLSLEHFAFETLPVSTHHSGEKRGLRQNPRHVVAAAAFASAEQFQREIARDQIAFEMLHISKVSFSRKCDLRLNPRHVVARCTFVQR